MRRPELQFEFPARYELTVLERIERGGGLRRVLGFPDAVPLDAQRELSEGVIVAVRPAAGQPWIGVFEHRHDLWTGGRDHIIGWPDEHSICVVHRGSATLVRTDVPKENAEIECWPVRDLLVVRDRRLVLFADFTSLVAYDHRGIAWATDRLVLDDLEIVRVEGDRVVLAGFMPDEPRELAVDLGTGALLE